MGRGAGVDATRVRRRASDVRYCDVCGEVGRDGRGG